MKKTICLVLLAALLACMLPASAEWLALTGDGEIAFVSTVEKLALREEPSAGAKWVGSYDVGDCAIVVFGRYWDQVNEIWWLQCSFEYGPDFISGWTGAKRFDITDDELYDLPLYEYVPDDWVSPDWCSGESEFDPSDFDYTYYPEPDIYGLATSKLALRSEPNNKSKEFGTYRMEGEWIVLTARHWDNTNSIWWVEVNFEYGDDYITGWTGLKRFDSSTFDLYELPEY